MNVSSFDINSGPKVELVSQCLRCFGCGSASISSITAGALQYPQRWSQPEHLHPC